MYAAPALLPHRLRGTTEGLWLLSQLQGIAESFTQTQSFPIGGLLITNSPSTPEELLGYGQWVALGQFTLLPV